MTQTTSRVPRKLLKKDKLYIVHDMYNCVSAKEAEMNGFMVLKVHSLGLA